MQAIRKISAEKRQSLQYIEQLFLTLCLTLEKRMVKHKFYCKAIGFTAKYEDGSRWDDAFAMTFAMQDAISFLALAR